MKILHTADWHLNDRLERQPRQPDLLRALGQIKDYLDEHQVDVMVVAGDLFSEHSSREQWRTAVGELKELFLPFMQRGGTIVAISGNHDTDAYFDLLRDALDMAATKRLTTAGAHATGRLYITSVARVLRLTDAQGEVVQFMLMPYPKASSYLRGQMLNFNSPAEKHQAVQAQFNRVLEELQRTQIDSALPTVLVSHIHVRGATAHSLYRISEAEDVIFESGQIPDYQYVAYGHIHKPGCINGAEHIRYSGSIDRMDLAEHDDPKGVVFVEIQNKRRVRVDVLPLDATPIYKVVIEDPDTEIPTLLAQYPDANRALVQYTLHWDPAKHNRDALAQEVERIFPRWYSRSLPAVGTQLKAATGYAADQLHDVAGNVHRYLEARLVEDPHRDELMKLADELLAEGEVA